MNDPVTNWKNVAAGFTSRAQGVEDTAWDRPSPCEGWVARDIVRHLAGWVPPLLAAGSGVQIEIQADVDVDPLAVWSELANGVSGLVDDPSTAASQFDHPQAGQHRLDDAVDMFITGDVLVHTWDLARATGSDDTLDADAVARVMAGMEAMGEAMVASGHYKARVELPAGASEQDAMIAATGRDPNWTPPTE